MAALVLWLGKGVSLIFWILFVCGCTADLLFLLLKNPTTPNRNQKEAGPINIYETLGLFLEPKMLLMTVVLIYSGFSQSFFYSRFPQDVSALDIKYLGFVMATFGAADTIGTTDITLTSAASVVMGRMSDRIGKKPILLIATLFGCAGYILTLGIFVPLKDIKWFFCIAVLLGVSDAGYNTQLYAVFGLLQPTKVESAYACMCSFKSS